jgi:hypothetical protein
MMLTHQGGTPTAGKHQWPLESTQHDDRDRRRVGGRKFGGGVWGRPRWRRFRPRRCCSGNSSLTRRTGTVMNPPPVVYQLRVCRKTSSRIAAANRRPTAPARSPLPPVAARLAGTVLLGFRSPSFVLVIFRQSLRPRNSCSPARDADHRPRRHADPPRGRSPRSRAVLREEGRIMSATDDADEACS